MSRFPTVGVTIVTYASANHIGDTIRSLPAADLCCIVVVDNASPDDTVAVVEGLGVENLRVVRGTNIGFGPGHNHAVGFLPEEAEYALLLNPDCTVRADDIAALVDYLDNHPRCALVGPALVRDGKPSTAAGALPTPRSEVAGHLPAALSRVVGGRAIAPEAERPGPVGYVEGAAMLVRLTAFRAVRGFDSRYFLCFEEMDLAHRLADAGWTVDLCPAAVAHHAGQGSRRQVALFSRYHQFRSQVLYLERWFGARRAHAYARFAKFSWMTQRLRRRMSDAEYRASADGVSGLPFRG